MLDLQSGEMSVAFLSGKCESEDKDYCCIIDEKYARKIFAQFTNFKFMGSVGFISALKERGILQRNQVDEIIKAIKKSDFRINNSYLGLLDEK